ncbi:unnamed protein product, partial [Phaeothamnion confervicola]
ARFNAVAARLQHHRLVRAWMRWRMGVVLLGTRNEAAAAAAVRLAGEAETARQARSVALKRCVNARGRGQLRAAIAQWEAAAAWTIHKQWAAEAATARLAAAAATFQHVATSARRRAVRRALNAWSGAVAAGNAERRAAETRAQNAAARAAAVLTFAQAVLSRRDRRRLQRSWQAWLHATAAFIA